MTETPRRVSKLGQQHAVARGAGNELSVIRPASSSAASADDNAPTPPVTRNSRRRRREKRPDHEMSSFNCKMEVGLRREIRKFAAEEEVDIQDVVYAALTEYLSARGVTIPGFDQHQPD